MTEKTELSNGVEVVPGKIAVSDFLKEAIAKTEGNRKFSGSLEELEALTAEHFENWKPGVGAVDGDVRIVALPPEGFFTGIVRITEENRRLLELVYNPRRRGEEPFPALILRGIDPSPAATVGIVIYRADVLARDGGRSSDAEWEIVAILADPELPEGGEVPMYPATMARNATHLQGGTLREYSAEQWLEATLFWQRHARVVPALEPKPGLSLQDSIENILWDAGLGNELKLPDSQTDYIVGTAKDILLLLRSPAGRVDSEPKQHRALQKAVSDILWDAGFASEFPLPEHRADAIAEAAERLVSELSGMKPTVSQEELIALADLIPLGFGERDGVRNAFEAAERIVDAGWRPAATSDSE